MVLGLLTSRFHHEREYYTAIAKCACYHNITVTQFTPFSIDPKTELIIGLLFDAEKQDWVKNQFAIPSHIYNHCTYKKEENSKKALPIIKWLQNRPQSLFLNEELPNGADMYETLVTNKKLAPYVPIIRNANKKTLLELLQLIQTKKNVVIKPLYSLSKQNMYHISYTDRTFYITTLDQNRFRSETSQTKNTFIPWLQTLLQTSRYIVQPMMQTPPVHIRILLQRNGKGAWEEQETLVQIDDTPYAFLFPLAKQTRFIPFKKWQHQLPKIKLTLLQDSLKVIATETPRALEDVNFHLFELELSIAMDANGAVWLYRVDKNPTYTTFTQHDMDLTEKTVAALLSYYRYLNRKKTRRHRI